MAILVDQSVMDARVAVRDFVVAYNDSHVDKIADLSFSVWVQHGRLYPVIQFGSLDYRDLKAQDDGGE